MGGKKKLRGLLGILKDNASLIKSILSIKRTTCSIHVAVLRATTHSSSPPPDHRVTAVLSLGNGSRATACTCVAAIMDRLHRSHTAWVSLKCLVVLHSIITRGSFILKDQFSFYPSAGGSNYLNLSQFRDTTDAETWGLSSWVRWYASVLERNLMTSRVLGSYFCCSSVKTDRLKDSHDVISSMDSHLLKEMDALVGMVEEICRAPESLHYQRNDLVYEVLRLVVEDYGSTQYQILIRLTEFGDRVSGLSSGELAELGLCLKRLEECRERLVELFVNRKRNDAFWDLIDHTKIKIAKVKEAREREMILVKFRRREGETESTRIGERVMGVSQLLGLPWLGSDRLQLTVQTAMA
ncbi:putative clathrin assembly protein At4g40080 [Cornus florida]|uniref:putative clathrin assembly protein At4g40080 n=1 Tax=Cornus florida TaxID=4283 RepID=UPI00289C1D99|nr:putative clathrin assembly protein At4g40080 [Cornus florida]